MQKEEMISLSAMQHVALIGVYQSLAWDLRFGQLKMGKPDILE